MSADPKELNRRCAEALGVVLCDQWTPLFHGYMQKGDCGHAACFPAEIPVDYCSEPSAALLLVEHWTAKGWQFQIDCREGHWEANFFDEARTYRAPFGAGPTFCLAVVNAFLQAVQEAGG